MTDFKLVSQILRRGGRSTRLSASSIVSLFSWFLQAVIEPTT